MEDLLGLCHVIECKEHVFDDVAGLVFREAIKFGYLVKEVPAGY